MCDTSDILSNTLHVEHDDPPLDTPRPTTPLPDRSRTLRRTISHTSIDTICPPKKKGVRRRIEEIAENMKHKSAKKKKKHSGTHDVPKHEADDVALESKASLEGKGAKRGRKAVSPLRDSSHRSEEGSVLVVADRLHSGVPFEVDPPLMFPGPKSDSLIDVPLFKEDGENRKDRSLPVTTLGSGAHVTAGPKDTTQSPPTAKIEDVQLVIRASEREVTIWDGLQAAHHVYKCRLFLRCTTHPYNTISLPDIRRIEMECNTRPAGSAYTRPPVFQAAYEGAAPDCVTSSSEPSSVKLAAGIHMDRVWCKIQHDDGTWGWYRDAYVPLSPRLFDKMDYREFKLVGRVWVGESCVEGQLTFGISMLLRGVDMRE